MSFITKALAWLKKTFTTIKTDGAKIAVAITADVQAALDSGTLDTVAKIIETVFPSVQHLPDAIVAELKIIIPKTLAIELAVIGLPDSPTEQDILDFEKRILEAFHLTDDKSKLYTTIAAVIYGILKRHIGEKLTFAQLVMDVEDAYQQYIAATQEG